jgi:hypothetical protein
MTNACSWRLSLVHTFILGHGSGEVVLFSFMLPSLCCLLLVVTLMTLYLEVSFKAVSL